MIGNHLRRYHNIIFKPDFEVLKTRKNVGLNPKNAFLNCNPPRTILQIFFTSRKPIAACVREKMFQLTRPNNAYAINHYVR